MDSNDEKDGEEQGGGGGGNSNLKKSRGTGRPFLSDIGPVRSFNVEKSLDFKIPSIMQKVPSSRPDDLRAKADITGSYMPIDEVLRLRFQLEELKQQKESLEEVAQKWVMVHKAIASLLLEVTEKDQDPKEFEREKQKLEKLDIVVIVDYIRKELRGLLGIKSEFEKELAVELDKKQAEFDRSLDMEKKALVEADKRYEELQQQLQAVNAQLDSVNNKKDQVNAEANQNYKKLEEELQLARERETLKDNGMEEKQNQLAKLHQVVRAKDTKLAKLSDMETRLQQQASMHDSERQQHQLEVQKLKEKCTALNERCNYTADAKKKLEDELKTISERMIDIKKHNYFNDYTEAAKRLERITNTVDTQSVQLRRCEDELKKSKQLNEELSAKMKEMEREYGKLGSQFSAVPSIKKKEKSAAISEEQYRKVLNESPHYVDAYKALLREKEAQIKDLTIKLRSLLVNMGGRKSPADLNSKSHNGSAKPQLATSAPPTRPSSSPSASLSSGPEEWVSKQMQRLNKASTYATHKNKESEQDLISDDEEEEEDEEQKEQPNPDRQWKGMKTPNMRTIKILKTPSEKELSVIARNPLYNSAANLMSRPPNMKSHMAKKNGVTGS